MDADRLLRDVRTSVSLPAGPERRLVLGGLLAVGVYAVWIGLSGLVVVPVAGYAGYSVSGPWTAGKTLLAAVVLALWALGPAWVGTRLLVDAMTNEEGYLRPHYRVAFPSTLVVPPLVVFGLVSVAGVALGEFPPPLVAALVAAGAFVLVRTLAYSYRVFSLSAPRAVRAFVFESGCLLALAVLVAATNVVGFGTLATDAAGTLDAALGTDAIGALVSGKRTVASVSVPTLPGLTAVFPVVLSAVYLTVQTLSGLAARARGVTAPRSAIRVDQRYPAFARPGTTSPRRIRAVSAGPNDQGTVGEAPGSPTTGGSATGGSGPNAAELGEASAGTVSNTRVFTPPADADLDESLPPAATQDAQDEEDEETSDADRALVEDDDTPYFGDSTVPDFWDEGPPTVGNDDAGVADDVGSTVAETGRQAGPDGDGYACPACGEQFSGDTVFAFCPVCGTELG